MQMQKTFMDNKTRTSGYIQTQTERDFNRLSIQEDQEYKILQSVNQLVFAIPEWLYSIWQAFVLSQTVYSRSVQYTN